jgi:outer membrane receptor protein involved in Fe transport
MNTQQAVNNQVSGNGASNESQINLRGLGLTQTLILIDGRRAPRINDGAEFQQADINGIPLSSIERIEVLPSTAGAIYGGGAVGGVINIIRRRDYTGLDVVGGLDGTFRGGGEVRRLEAYGGLALWSGTTSLNFSASISDSDPLYLGDNDLWRRGRELLFANSPFPKPGFLGATPNIRAATNLVLDDGTPLNSNITFVPVGYAGVASDGGAALVANAGKFNLDLSEDVAGARRALRSNPIIKSLDFGIRQKLTNHLEAYADASIYSNLNRVRYLSPSSPISLPASSPVNPFRQSIQVFLPTPGLSQRVRRLSETLLATGGLIWKLPRHWSTSIEYQWGKSHTESSFRSSFLNPQGLAARSNGTINPIRDVVVFPIDYTPYLYTGPDTTNQFTTIQNLMSSRSSGPIFSLPGGTVVLTALLEHRKEDAIDGRIVLNSVTSGGVFSSDTVYFDKSQTALSAYAELRVPILSGRNEVPLLYEVELTASLRSDRYRTKLRSPSLYDNGAPPPTTTEFLSKLHSTDYTLAAKWAPVRDLLFRASVATGFLPPSLAQIEKFGPSPSFSSPPQDPMRGGELLGTIVPYEVFEGGDPNVRPESSRSFSAGLILTPRFLPGLRLSADYTRIRKSDEIAFISEQDLLDLESSFPERVVRAPPIPGDPPSWAGPVLTLDVSNLNIARSRVSAWDYQADYDVKTRRLGNFHFYAIATHQTEFKRQLTSNAPVFDTVDFRDGPLAWRGNGGIDWSSGPVQLGWNIQYYNSYSIRRGAVAPSLSYADVVLLGAERVPRQIYNDVSARYTFAPRGLMRGLVVSAGVQNVFDAKPPVLANAFTGFSPYGDPRLRRFTLRIQKHF